MRIISGKFKSKRITAPKKLPVRPTTDMAKESLFNILNNYYYFENISVLDLCAGTGNISYEFASRGTSNITTVDSNYGCIKFIEQTSKSLDLDIQIVKSDIYNFLEKTTLTFDIIFSDPPYAFETSAFQRIADITFERSLLNNDGLLIIEHSKHTPLENHSNFSYAKKYGGNMFSFFEAPTSEE